MRREELLARLEGDVSLPALPEVLAKLDQVLADPDVDVRDVATLVSTDTVLAGQVLRMANSAYYSRGGSAAATLGAGIQRLGLRTVKGLVYALTLPRLFGGGDDFPHRRMWRHALAVGAFAREVAAMCGAGVEEREKVYLAGLVHDVGSLILSSLAPREYAPWLDSLGKGDPAVEWNDEDLTQFERERFGIDHAEIGWIFLGSRWRMPSPVPEVARHHHDMGWDEILEPAVRQAILVVHVANGVCNHAGLAWDRVQPQGRAFNEGAWEQLGLDLAAVDELLGKVRDSVRLAEELLALGG